MKVYVLVHTEFDNWCEKDDVTEVVTFDDELRMYEYLMDFYAKNIIPNHEHAVITCDGGYNDGCFLQYNFIGGYGELTLTAIEVKEVILNNHDSCEIADFDPC